MINQTSLSRELIYEYENMLLDNKATLSAHFFERSEEMNERTALALIQYVIERYLRWSPEYAYAHFTKEVADSLRLDAVMRFVRFPPECDETQDYFILPCKIWPRRLKMDFKKMVLLVYDRVMTGKMKKFPKDFFTGNRGNARAMLCLQKALSNNLLFMDVASIYEKFSTQNGVRFLKNVRLHMACTLLYEMPLDYLHATLGEQADELWYHYYRFKVLNQEQIKNYRKNGQFVA